MDDFRAQVDTNLLGAVYVTKAALPVLRRQGSGHIIQVSWIGGRLATPGLSAYQAAKWADMDEPPLRFILGSEAYAYSTAAARARAESDLKWHDLTVSADRDDATAADRDPLGTRA